MSSHHRREEGMQRRSRYADATTSGERKQRSRSPENDVDFAAAGVGEFLEADPRPTFVVYDDFGDDLEPVYLNKAIRANEQLSRSIPFKARPNSPPHPTKTSGLDFVAWVREVPKISRDRPSTISFLGLIWTGFVLRSRWVVVSGDLPFEETGRMAQPLRSDSPNVIIEHKASEVLAEESGKSKDDLSGHVSQRETDLIPGTPDWTVANPEGYLSPHMIFARSIDWASTPLGDMTTWSREFRQVCNLMMANPHPAALFWGEELTLIYNKAYADGVAGRKHPAMMGTGYRGGFKELWSLVKTIFDECRIKGRSYAVDDQMLPIERQGFLEETFYSWSLTPLYGGTNEVLGLYNAPLDVTRQHRNARALKTLLKLGQSTSLATTVATFWKQTLKALEENAIDFPFAILYSVVDDLEADDASSTSSGSDNSLTSKCCVLEGTLGVPDDHPAAPRRLDLRRARGGFVPSFREASKTREPKLVNLADGSIPRGLLEGIQWRGFGEPCREAVVCPIRPTTSENVMGFLCVGVNPRRPYDEDYESFIQLLERTLATSLASVSLLETEVLRGLTAAEAAALERSRLSEELAVQRSRLQRIAEVSPVGMFSIDPEGMLLQANDRWYQITDHPRDTVYPMSWLEPFAQDCRELIKRGWEVLTEEKLPWSSEVKLEKTWYDSVRDEEVECWILAAASPEFSDGVLKSVMGSITDISYQKRSEKDAETRARLSEQLLLRTQEAKENEKNFKRFSDLSPGGLVIMDPKGSIEYANSQWHRISGLQVGSINAGPLSWISGILEDDQHYFSEKWEQLITEKKSLTIEVRMRTEWEGDIGGTNVRTQRWILASLYPEEENGALRSVMGCITDISSIKWAEGLQNRRLKDSEETRRAQNNFIDITSHEMRNPLSAIIQCADGITSSLNEISSVSSEDCIANAIKESVSAAETIQLCAQHQKNIVDDILTISKLDSNLLVITPVPVQPIFIVQQAIQMFSVECQKVHDINLEFQINDSYRALHVTTVMLDSSRLLQILINLMTNAIKFTKTSDLRSINVTIDASLQPPSKTSVEFDYFPTKKGRALADLTTGHEWGNGEVLYLHFAVRDSGCGLTAEEKKKLFHRFQQASPRTHIQYGGSGLGLFISRQLAELQGGEIGVASEAGKGSTFAFYVKVRRSEANISTEKMLDRLSGEIQSNARLATDVPQTIRDIKVTTIHELAETKTGVSDISKSSGSDPKDWHVLVVEDNLVNQKILAQQLRKLGSTVHVANHGQEALDMIKKSKYYTGLSHLGTDLSVVLMDLEMPVMDGLTAVKLIRKMETKGEVVGHLPVIAVTANARGEQIAMAKDSGMDSVVSKPFRIKDLLPKIAELVS